MPVAAILAPSAAATPAAARARASASLSSTTSTVMGASVRSRTPVPVSLGRNGMAVLCAAGGKKWRQEALATDSPASLETDSDGDAVVSKSGKKWRVRKNPALHVPPACKPGEKLPTDQDLENARLPVFEIAKKTHAVVLAGGGGNLVPGELPDPLTLSRARGAVPIGGSYRIIDVPISNCLNSGVNKVYVMTQWNSTSLNSHIRHSYRPSLFGGRQSRGFVDAIPAVMTPDDESWFQGSADAVRRNLRTLKGLVDHPEYYLVLSAEALYRMDYADILATHVATDADVTICCTTTDHEHASSLGVLATNGAGRVVGFAEKPNLRDPEDPEDEDAADLTEALREQWSGRTPWATEERPFTASMGVYVFKASVMEDLLENPETHFGISCGTDKHFGRDVLPHALRKGLSVQCHHFGGYWEDISSLTRFFNTNLQFAERDAPFSMYDKDFPMYTRARNLPPSTVNNCDIEQCLLADGSRMVGSSAKRCVIGACSVVDEGCEMEDVFVMGNGTYDSAASRAERIAAGEAVPGIGGGSVIRRAIIDRNVSIGAGCRVTNEAGVKNLDRSKDGWVIKDGIVVFLRGAVIPDGTVI